MKLRLWPGPAGSVEAGGRRSSPRRLVVPFSLTKVETHQLADFTERHIGRRGAIVIDGQAVTSTAWRRRSRV